MLAAIAIVGILLLVGFGPIPAALFVIPVGGVWMLKDPRRTTAVLVMTMLFLPATIALSDSFVTRTLFFFGGIALCLIGFTQRWARGQVRLSGSWAIWLALGLLSALAIIAGGPIGEISIALRPYLFVAVLAWFLRAEFQVDRGQIRPLLLLLGWATFALAVFALYQWFTGTWPLLDQFAEGRQYTSDSYFGRPGGTQGHPILYGLVAAFGAIVALATRMRGWLLIAAFNVVGVGISGSRSAYVALAVAVVVYFLSTRRLAPLRPPTRWQLGGLGALLLAGVVFAIVKWDALFEALLQPLLERINVFDDPSGSARTLRLDIGWDIITSDPLAFLVGHGPGFDLNYLSHYGIPDNLAVTFDNLYVSVWINFGLLGFVALAGTMLLGFFSSGYLGRSLIALVAVDMFFFYVTSWPAALTVLALGWALGGENVTRVLDENGFRGSRAAAARIERDRAGAQTTNDSHIHHGAPLLADTVREGKRP